MSSTESLLRSIASGASSGGSGSGSKVDESVVYVDQHNSSATDQHEDEARAENSTVDDLLPGSDESQTASADKGSPKPGEKSQTPGTRESITITDDKGRRKIEVDFSNKEELKRYVEKAYGASKLQSQRDSALQSNKAIQAELQELKSNWKQLEDAYKGGEEALFDMLQGRKGAFGEMVQKRIERAQYLKNASPEEIQALEAREQNDKTKRELDKLRRDNEEFKKSVSQEREQAELRSMESRVNPVFDKYRFAEKLGDANDEHMFDEMLWNSALKRLEPYEEQGVELTQELIDREFREVAQSIRRRINVQAQKTATRVVEQKKKEATENVQAKVMSGYKTTESAKEARGLIESNDITKLLKNWGKYGSLFRK